MQNITESQPQKLVLPFMKRRRSPVAVIYDHRAGIYALVAMALTMAILFITSRIVVRTPRVDSTIMVDVRTVEELRAEARRLQREVMMRQNQAEAGSIRNAISNAGANELADDRNTDVSAMNEQIRGNNAGLQGNRDAWNQGLREIEAMRRNRVNNRNNGNNGSSGDSRAKGRVLVEYLLTDPLRQRDYLPPPGYLCERTGVVVVDITVNRNGEVTAARVNNEQSDGDLCMRETALNYALRSRFNIDTSAPERHSGTITYTFIAQ
jgi:hypothetical protein